MLEMPLRLLNSLVNDSFQGEERTNAKEIREFEERLFRNKD